MHLQLSHNNYAPDVNDIKDRARQEISLPMQS